VVTAVAAPAVGITMTLVVGTVVMLATYVIAVTLEPFVGFVVVVVVVVTERVSLGNMGAHNTDHFHNHRIAVVVVVVVGNVVVGVAMDAIYAHN
jgi:hypothetical protein